MLIIRQAQMESMEATLFSRFIDRVCRFIRVECDLSSPIDGSTLPSDDVALAAVIRDLVAHAGRYGVTTELGYVFFVILGLGYHREFYRLEELEEILRNPRDTPVNNVKTVLKSVIRFDAGHA